MRWMVAGIAVFAVSNAYAQDLPAPAKPFVTRCAEAGVTGFVWKDGGWTSAAFTPRALLIEKFNPARHGRADNDCAPDDEDKVEEEQIAGVAWLNGCYSVMPENEAPLFRWCTEHYDYLQEKWALRAVTCSAVFNDHPISFKPDGLFVYSMADPVLPDKPGAFERDLRLSHGRCKTVK
jgi:hypothetical protein